MNPPALAITPERLPESRLSPAGIGAVLLAAAFWPVWRWYGLRLNDGSDEPFGLIALGFAVWLLWQHRDRLAVSPLGATAAVLILIGYSLGYPFLPAMIRALLAIAAIGLFIGVRRVPPAIWGLLALSLPFIATAQFFAGWPLRLTTAAGSEFLLNLAGMEVIREGTVLQWQGNPVAVDPPCSGIRMLWAGLFVHFALAAIHQLRWRTLLWLTPVAFLAILLANVIRATLLFFKESGTISLPEWTHAGIGMIVFAIMLVAFALLYPKLRPLAESFDQPIPSRKIQPSFIVALAVLALVASLKPLIGSGSSGSIIVRETGFPGWPATFEGETLTQVPLTRQESAFAKNFPGELGVFETPSGRKVILRWVTRPTRKLHSSADCLRAAGFTVEPEPSQSKWAHWKVRHPDHGAFHAREQIRDSRNDSWTEPSAWFWSASLRKTEAPWWAVTVLDPSRSMELRSVSEVRTFQSAHHADTHHSPSP